MYIHGEFINERGRRIRVEILTNHDRTEERVIGEDGLYFARTKAVTLETECDDLFSPILMQSASIRLQSSAHIPELYALDCLDVVVNVRQKRYPVSKWELVFAGYVLPLAYSQPYDSCADDLELSCVDALGALQYRRYGNVDRGETSWQTKKEEAAAKSLLGIVRGCISEVTRHLIITPRDTDGAGATDGSVNVAECVVTDGSATMDASSGSVDAMAGTGVSEALFYQGEEEETWTLEKVVSECVKFCNLHIRQDGCKFRIFNWTAAALASGAQSVEANQSTTYGTGHKIEIGEIYNKFELTDNLYPVDMVIANPLDKETMGSDYAGRQLYCRTYSGTYESKDQVVRIFASATAMMCAINGLTPAEEYNESSWTRRDWFVRLRTAPGWTFSCYGPDQAAGRHQGTLLSRSGQKLAAAIVSLRSETYKWTKDDSSNQYRGEAEQNDYLFVSTGLSGYGYRTAKNPYFWPEKTMTAGGHTAGAINTVLMPGSDYSPLAVYKGGKVNLSPVATDVTRYLVFSGSILLNGDVHGPVSINPVTFVDGATKSPIVSLGVDPAIPYDPFGYLRPNNDKNYTIEWDGNKSTHFMSLFYEAETPSETPEAVSNPGQMAGSPRYWGLPMPETEVTRSGGMAPIKYNGTAGSDRVDFLPILACRLRIGKKVLVETSWGKYEWRIFKNESECSSLEEYHSQIFALGINPKKNDAIVGTFVDIADTSAASLGIEETGTAIPIRSCDRLHGQLIFEIMGIYNLRTDFDNYNPRPRAWWLYPGYPADFPESLMLLNYVSGIWIRDFEAKVVSDNGKAEANEDKDVVYTSATSESFINKCDDLTFEICSALTPTLRKALGVNDRITLSVAVDMRAGKDGIGVSSIYSKGQQAQGAAEQLYVDYYYNLMSTPHIVLEQGFKEEFAKWDNVYTHQALGSGYRFFPIGIKRDLSEGSAIVKCHQL